MTEEDEEFNRVEREAKQRMEAVSAALDKKAENARELGLDYEPSSVSKLAREAGVWGAFMGEPEDLERFAELIRADEREACAKVCETEWSNVAERIYGEECAAVIRARSNT